MPDHNLRWDVHIQWSEDDDCFIAKAPDFEGFSGLGDSYTEAASDLELAMSLEVAAIREEAEETIWAQTIARHRSIGCAPN